MKNIICQHKKKFRYIPAIEIPNVISNQQEEIEYFSAHYLPLSEKANIQTALDTYGSIRLGKGDYRGVDRGWASNSPILGVGSHSMIIDMSNTDLSPTITIDGVLLDYTASGIEPFDLWMLASGFRVVVRNNSEVAIDLEEMFAVGDVEGDDLVMNRNFATPIKREMLTTRKIM